MNANLNVASSKMSAMLCCSGEKDSAVRDLKSAQNTPSRQPMQAPYTMGSGQFMAPAGMGPNQQPPPPPLPGQQGFMPGQGPPPAFRQPMYAGPPPLNQQARMMGPGQMNSALNQNPMGNNMMANSATLGPKDDYRKVQ
jgi:hypothetical protein